MSYTKLRLQIKRTTALFITKLKTKLPNQIIAHHRLLTSPFVSSYLLMSDIFCHRLTSSDIFSSCLLLSDIVSYRLLSSDIVSYRLLIDQHVDHILYNVTYYHITSILYFVNHLSADHLLCNIYDLQSSNLAKIHY